MAIVENGENLGYTNHMNTKDTMTKTQTLALVYAEKLVAWHEALNSNWSDKGKVLRVATEERAQAEYELNSAAEAEAMVC